MPHIIGTAGHIDHGKTALVRALTGIDTDRLDEEKERGISIDLGFAYLDLSSGERAGIVDVPGHERFIKNMLAGAHGIDVVLLVVAADDGVMPQTEEHLDIVHMLGVRRGVVAITKTDLVEASRIAAVREEVEILLAGTALEGSPVVAVSSATGAGIESLRSALEQSLDGKRSAAPERYFRLPLDRVFSLRGHGTVVTGTAVAGVVRPGDAVAVLPGDVTARVRTVHVHGMEVAEAEAGQRIALNLGGVEHDQLQRGDMVCDPQLRGLTDRFDARVELRPAVGKGLKNHAPIRIYAGTAEALGKLVLLAGDQLGPRQSAYVQLVLRRPLALVRGDRFVLRNESAQRTIGGGMVLHPFARRHRRGDVGVLGRLEQLEQAAEVDEVVALLLAMESAPVVEIERLAQALGLRAARLVEAIRAAGSAVMRLLPDAESATACVAAERWGSLRARIVDAIAHVHAEQPMIPGLEMEGLRAQIAPDLSPKIFRILIDGMVAEKLIRRDDSTIRLPTHEVRLPREEEGLARRIEEALERGGVTPPDLREIEAALRVTHRETLPVLRQLEREGRVAKIDETLYFAAAAVERARDILREHVRGEGEITAAQFRTLLGASRKFSIGLLDYFDRTGFTLRVGDVRKLRRG